MSESLVAGGMASASVDVGLVASSVSCTTQAGYGKGEVCTRLRQAWSDDLCSVELLT
jgi:hypothetical protein